MVRALSPHLLLITLQPRGRRQRRHASVPTLLLVLGFSAVLVAIGVPVEHLLLVRPPQLLQLAPLLVNRIDFFWLL